MHCKYRTVPTTALLRTSIMNESLSVVTMFTKTQIGRLSLLYRKRFLYKQGVVNAVEPVPVAL